MNYDLFIPASGYRSTNDAAISAAQLFGEGQSHVSSANRAALRPPQSSASEQLSTNEVKNTVVAFNEVFEQADIGVRYRFEQDTDELVVTLVNRDTEEVLRQVPPEQILKMRQRLEELMGIIFDGTA
jgi:flagellar protein FlaG